MSKAGLHAGIIAQNLGLGTGESARNAVCPECDGGATGERSFSVTREAMGLVYNCYRASCQAAGFIPDVVVNLDFEREKRAGRTALRPYTGELRPLSLEDEAYFLARFGLRSDTSGAHIEAGKHDYMLPIYNPSQFIRGYVQRQPTWKPLRSIQACPRKGDVGLPKARTFMHAAGPIQSWYFTEDKAVKEIVLVEDQLSAMKVAQNGCTAVALLGTNMTDAKAMEIQQEQPTTVLIALDEDAIDVGFRMAEKWCMAFSDLRVVILEQDLKDTDNKDIQRILGVRHGR